MKTDESVGTQAANGFAIETFGRMVGGDPNSNWVYSPASLWFVLGMGAAGASGRTRDEMTGVMGIGGDLGPLVEARAGISGSSNLKMGNMVLCHDGYLVKQNFVDWCRAEMGSESWTRNFGDPKTVPEVNGWISDVTAGKIPELLGGLNPMLRMILINAIYFKGKWEEPFKDAVAKQFRHPDGPSECWMMKREKGELRYCQGDGFQAVKLPYADRRSSMVLMLPNEGHTPASVLGHLIVSGWQSVVGAMRTTEVEVQLPRFSIQRTMERELMSVLQQMGMRDAFSVRDSDFSRMTDANDLYVQSILQRALIEVDEEGTEAAAATAMMFALRSVSLGPVQVVFDRPFVYAIVDDVTGLISFVGVVDRP